MNDQQQVNRVIELRIIVKTILSVWRANDGLSRFALCAVIGQQRTKRRQFKIGFFTVRKAIDMLVAIPTH
jgi:hypothetical protein